MSNFNAIEKNLKSLNVSGYGEYISRSNHSELGQGMYLVDLDNCVLRIFERGVSIGLQHKSINVPYDDISKITSHLSARVFSEASASKNLGVSVPLEIHVSDGVVVLLVQLLIYSRLVIVLNELWRSGKL